MSRRTASARQKHAHEPTRQRLVPMPGGKSGYVQTTLCILREVRHAGQMSVNALGQWVVTTYGITNHRPNEYVWDLVHLGVLADGNNLVCLTPMGYTVLEATPEACDLLFLDGVLRHYVAGVETLRFVAENEQPVTRETAHRVLRQQFTSWNESTSVERRLNWLLSTGAVRDAGNGRYAITPRGKAALTSFDDQMAAPLQSPLVNEPEPIPSPPVPMPGLTDKTVTYPEWLVAELKSAACDGQHFKRLEHRVTAAFTFLGFNAELYGTAGNTDVFLSALVSGETYRVVVDAKAKSDGCLYEINPAILNKHRVQHGADYAVVVANSFANGQIIQQAVGGNIVLLPVSVLCDWIVAHAEWPLNRAYYRTMFTTPGLVRQLPDTLCTAYNQHEHLRRCLHEVFQMIHAGARIGTDQPLSAQTIYTVLAHKWKQISFTESEVTKVFDFLANPLVSAGLYDGSGDFQLAMNEQALCQTLTTLIEFMQADEAKS